MQRKRRKIIYKPLHTKCPFCVGKTTPSYKQSDELKGFISDRARILPAQRSGLCAKHQRRLAKEVKLARLLALLPASQKT